MKKLITFLIVVIAIVFMQQLLSGCRKDTENTYIMLRPNYDKPASVDTTITTVEKFR